MTKIVSITIAGILALSPLLPGEASARPAADFVFTYSIKSLTNTYARADLDLRLRGEARRYCRRMAYETRRSRTERACEFEIINAVQVELRHVTR
ncbi:MAG: UrcA family protein [Parvularculaceae bacterium]